ncbi:serine protease, DegP/HtrA, do-like [Lachnospiraceae bacterium KM106-2]|nr:serine protease, DegP/HtrA, do-like [Lachnospiraceae bacterium KM106-2]
MDKEFQDNNQAGNENPEYGFWADQLNMDQKKEEEQQSDQWQANYSETQQNSSVYRMTGNDVQQDQAFYDSFYQQPQQPKPPKKQHKVLRSAALVVILGVIVGGVLFMSNKLFKEDGNGQLSNQVASATSTPAASTEPVTPGKGTSEIGNTKTVEDSLNKDNVVIDVAKNAMPSIVSITSTVEVQNYFGQSGTEQGSGSGIIIKKTDDSLLIATNNHVVADAKSIHVTFNDNKTVKATVKGTDSSADLAVVTVKLSDMKKATLEKIKVISLGNSDDVKVGEMAIAIGNALGYGQSVTVGYVSAKDRKISTSSSTSTEATESSMTLLQTDAAINPGNSGGALLNGKGELIGINSAKFASTSVEGMGYAIPITKAVPIINELMDREVLKSSEKGYLGISGSNVSETEHSTYNIPLGVLVSAVSDDGAAKAAGIKVQDIITKINGTEVTSITSLAERVNSYRVGTKVTLTVARLSEGGYKTVEIKVTLKGEKTLSSIENSTTQSQQNQSGASGNSGNSNNNNNSQQNGGSSDDFNIWDYFNN